MYIYIYRHQQSPALCFIKTPFPIMEIAVKIFYMIGASRIWGPGMKDSNVRTCWGLGFGAGLGRALGHFLYFSLIGLKRIFFTNIFQ